jgi:hypothetical protein
MFFSKPREFPKQSERLLCLACNNTFTEIFSKTTIMNYVPMFELTRTGVFAINGAGDLASGSTFSMVAGYIFTYNAAGVWCWPLTCMDLRIRQADICTVILIVTM